MNREIKFRAWDKKTKNLRANPTAISNIGGGINTIFSTDYPLYEWMQYTGVKDKNGKEIFEGDVLTSCAFTHPVIFQDGSFTWDGQPLLSWDYLALEIIGNIYENPELLEDK